MKDKKKVILINGNSSNWYEQVIFIVKEQNQQIIPKNLAKEAEKIINEYMTKKYNSTTPIKNKPTNKQQEIPPPKQNNFKQNNFINRKKIKFYNNVLNVSIVCTLVFICYLLYQIWI